MQTRKLGKSGIDVSIVGLGTNNFGDRIDLDATREVLHAALDLGVTLIDTAESYGKVSGASEEFIGQLLGSRRKDVVLATKFGLRNTPSKEPVGGTRAYIMEAVNESLTRLKTDWIDVYQMHRPDDKTPIDDTLRALEELVKSGKVRAIGCSNFTGKQVDAAMKAAQTIGTTPFTAVQDQYSLLARGIEQELLPAIEQHGLGLLPYFPLASGLLTGKYKPGAAMPQGSRLSYSDRHIERFVTDANWKMVEELQAFCDRRNRSILELAFGWLLANPSVSSVIAGATKPEQLEGNVKATGWMLTSVEIAEVNRITHAATDPNQGRLPPGSKIPSAQSTATV
jgi:aryl-alcohol dehydrogenase-like predicted oxidoreductase